MGWLSKLASRFEALLLPWGMWGLAAAAILDSSFIPFPSGVDLWMITLAVRDPAQAPLLVFVASVGSVAGASILYFTARKGEEVILGSASAEKMAQARRKIERSGEWAIIGGALLPPPAPFKLFVLAAGLLRFPWPRFALALLAGRAIRYALEAYLAVRYGRQAWEMLLRAGPWAFLAALLIAIVALLIVRSRRKTASTQS